MALNRNTYEIEYWFLVKSGDVYIESEHFKQQYLIYDGSSWLGPEMPKHAVSFKVGNGNNRLLLTPNAMDKFSINGNLGYDFIKTKLEE